MQISNLASKNWFIQNFSTEMLQKLVADGLCFIKNFKKGEIIHHYADNCTALEVILEGQVTINRYDSSGNIVNVSTLKSGETLGGNLLYSSHTKYPFEISALSQSILLQIEKGALLELLKEYPDLLIHFLKDLSDKSLMMTQTIESLSEKSLRQRILFFLQSESDKKQSQRIFLNQTKKQLAERFGVARTSLSRELKAMADDGLIAVEKHVITLLNLK